MERKIRENKICFWDNCIWIDCVKLFLLKREYLLSALNVLKNSLKILNICKRDFKNVQNLIDISKMQEKNGLNVFCSWDNCI